MGEQQEASLPSPYPPAPFPRCARAHVTSAAASQPLMEKGRGFEHFVPPVVDLVGPYYLNVIDKPMDMATMKLKATHKVRKRMVLRRGVLPPSSQRRTASEGGLVERAAGPRRQSWSGAAAHSGR